MRSDPRLVTGTVVHTKAKYVSSEPDCKRLFGSQWKHKRVNGRVVRCESKKGVKVTQTFVAADWGLPSCKVYKPVLLRHIEIGPAPPRDNNGNTLYHGRNEEEDVADPLHGAPKSLTDGSTVNEPSPAARPALPPRLPAKLQRPLQNVTNSVQENLTSHTDVGAPAAKSEEIVAHGQVWRRDSDDSPINGAIPGRSWQVRASADLVVTYGSEWQIREVIDYFLLMFPSAHLPDIVRLTSEKLEEAGHKPTSAGEILRFFGVLILMSRFEISGSRRNLWARCSEKKYLPAPNFGAAMPRWRFDAIIANIRYCEQPIRSATLSSARHRWALVNDFVDAINAHRSRCVTPSDSICVDENIVRWYGLGGHWIEVGLPHYVALDRKPDSGCEIQNAACGSSGIMLRLELATTAEETEIREFECAPNHGTAVLQRLVEPWLGSNRFVCADAYFSSVETCERLLEMGLKFTGVVKTATRRYPMAYLSALEMSRRGDQNWLSSQLKINDTEKKIMALCWVDKARRFFVSTAGTVRPGKPYERERWRQLENGPAKVTVVVGQPQVVEKYYDTCAAIDRHNRCRQDDLGINRKVEVKDYANRQQAEINKSGVVQSGVVQTY